MVGEVGLFSESDDPESADDSMVSLMTTKEGGISIDIHPNLSSTQLI